MYTRAPFFTKTLAVARPIPEFPPVMTAIFPSSFGISSSSLSVEPSVSGSEAGIRLQWNDHRRLQVAFADERKRVELFRDFVRRSGFHNCASASGVTAKRDLPNQTDRVEVTYHLELRLPEVCGSRLFPLSGCQENRVMNCILSAPVDTSICLHLARYQHMLLNQDGDHHMNERTRHARGRCHCTELRKA